MASTRRWYGLGFTAAMLAALLVPVVAGAAPAATVHGDRVGAYDPATSYWSLDGGGSFLYGNPADAPFMGDWNCDGIDTPGLHRPVDTAQGPAGKVYLRNSNSTGIADVEYFFGDPGDIAFAGDFNGNGCDSVGLYRPATGQVFLTNLLGSRNRGIGAAQVTYTFPAQGHDLTGARVIAADFDGDGIDTVALHLPATGVVLGVGATPMTFGNPGDQLVAGAFGGSVDSLGVYRGGSFLLSGPGELTASSARSLRAGAGTVALSWSAAAGPAPRSSHGGPCAGPHPNLIVGTPNADVINGGNGDDVIDGRGGNDVIGGKNGNDTICGGDGDDILNGDRGNDTIYGDAGVDNVNGGDDNDTLHGGEGADIITGDKDDDTLFGDGGADNMNGGNGNDFLDGGDGDDLMSGSGGDDTLLGRNGADVINGGPQFDTCDVGPGGASATKCENQRPQALNQSETVQEDDGDRTFAFATVDPDGDPTMYVVQSGPTPNKGVLTVNSTNGTFTYNPAGAFESLAVGEHAFVTFTYDATDVYGAVSDVATVTIKIEGNNDAPTAGDDAASTNEDSATVTGNVLANDTDPDTTDVLFVSAVVATSANDVPITNNGDGTFGYDPSGVLDHLDQVDTLLDTFEYTVSDGNGGSDVGKVTVTVTGLDDPPFAGDDTASTDEDTATTIAVLGNDGDPDADDTVSVIAPVNDPTGFSSNAGAAMVKTGNTFSYDPATAFNYLAVGESATDTFTYEIASDNVGTAKAAVTITIAGRNDAPTADDQTVAGTGTFVITLTGSDPDTSDDLDFSVPDTTTASGTLANLVDTNGTCAPAPCTAPDKNSATVEYKVPSGGAVPDSFAFTVDDDNGGIATGTVTINPDPAGDPTPPPTDITNIVAKDGSVEVVAGTPKEIVIQAAAPGTIDDLTFSIVSGPPAGEGSITAGPTDIIPNDPSDPVRSAKVTYDPGAFVGSPLTSPDTSFTFQACEVAVPANCDQAVISIDVAAATPAAPPQAGPLSGTVNTNSTATINLADGLGATEGEDDGLPKGRSHTGNDPDIYILVDVTGSMSDDLDGIENDIGALIASVKTVWPNAHFGLGTYDDIDTTNNPLPGPFPTLFDNLVTLKPDDGSSGGTSGDVSDAIGAPGQQLVNSFAGDTPEAQFFALERLASTSNPAGFNPNTPSVIVYIGDAPAHDPVCEAVHGVAGLGAITEQSVIAALLAEGGAGISVVANSIDGAGLDADPNGFGPSDYDDGTAPDCTPVGGDAGQATRITSATGGSFHVDANSATLASAVLAAIDGRPAEFSYQVLVPAGFAGTLTTSTGATVPVGVLTTLPDAKVVYNSTGITLGTQTQFQYKVTSSVTGLSVIQDVFIAVTQVGSCEVSADFCDDGRP